MSSYKHDGRIPRPRDFVSQCRDTPPPAFTAQPSFRSVPVSHSPKPQLARPVNSPSTYAKTSSFSAREQSHPILAPSKLPGSSPVNNACHSLLPRPAGQSISLKSHRHPTKRSPTGQSRQQPSGHAMSKPHTPPIDAEAPANFRPKNALRRKAATIGQHTESGRPKIEATQPEKLSVVIPSDPITGHVRNTTPQTPLGYAELDGKVSSTSTRDANTAPKIAEFQPGHGPKELASLRTTINTQNLPPPTPTFPISSSPSTRYSESPGIWSRTSTPTSLSSCSPGIVHPVKVGYRSRQPNSSQTRLPVFSPPMQSSPQMDRSYVNARKISNTTKEAELSPSTSHDESAGRFQGMDSARTTPTSRELSGRNLPTRSNLPKRMNSDTDVLQSQIDEAERNVFDPRKLTRTRTADSLDSVQVPARPSREGTHHLELEPSPIIQSNLPPYSLTNHKRRDSGDNLPSARKPHLTPSQSAAASVDSLQSRSSSRIPPRTTTSPATLKKTRPTLAKEEEEKNERKSPVKAKRFGLFPTKSTPEIASERRSTRKGPAAGTGYEGFGKYGQPGRRTSVSSSGSGTRSISTVGSGTKPVSTRRNRKDKSDFELDDFLMNRLEPVVISGGGMDGSALSRMQSADSASGLSTASSSIGEHSKMPFSTSYSTDSVATSLGTSGKLVSAESGLSSPSHSTLPRQRIGGREADSGDGKVHRSHGVTGKAPGQPPLGTNETTVSFSFFYDQDSKVTALAQSTATQSPRNRGGDLISNRENAQTQKGKFSKWNFFQRSRRTDRKSENVPTTHHPTTQLPATISTVHVNRPVAHYAFVDDDSDPLEEIMHRIDDSPPTGDEEKGSGGSVEVPAGLNIRKVRESILLPSPPQVQAKFSKGGPSSPTVFFNKSPFHDSPETCRENKRQSRLESVGRIPQVVSKRDREHKPAFESFSRPFSITDTPSVPAPVGVQQRDQHTPSRDTFNTCASAPPSDRKKLDYDLTQPFGDPLQKSSLDFLAGPYSSNEFLTFSRKGSDQSSSSGSRGLSTITAVIPNSSTDFTADEIWGEYDDLIDHLSPETSMSAGPSHSGSDEKFELATMASKTLQSELNENTETQVPPIQVEHPDGAFNRGSSGSTDDIIRLRRSKIIPALQSPIQSSSQPSYSDIIAAYHEGSTENVDIVQPGHISPRKHSVQRQSSPLIPASLATSQDFESSRQRNTILFDIAERDREGPTIQTNLRSGSLMTSRWLSFGRVLFSPAHNHVKNREQERILVIDGLGNDDWSFYCSLTYPKAEVYSLTIGRTTGASTNPAAWKPPINHHTIHHANLERSLPFPKGFFAVIVLRFPYACSEHVQNNIVSECKRVLRPGGYLEMSILDLDMVNMGIRTRKAVRRLKERTYLADPNISLKPASDSIQRLLGRHGFVNLRRCMVRIPTTGMILRSSGSSSSSNPSVKSANSSFPKFSKPNPQNQTKSSDEKDLSLGDLLSDPSPSATNDESITKIVAKVGRWWYTRCYEVPILPDGDIDLSIWADKRVLRECQKGGTGFRLLIAYTQKPSERRRTASV